MFSIVTVASSTRMPTASAMPPSVMRCMFSPVSQRPNAAGISAEQLRQEHRNKGMPDDLANILELAGQADVRILILDADAPALLGLPLAEF